jgi:VIT1/CCC1 family predicted Fe2+/Mn2+ transporter
MSSSDNSVREKAAKEVPHEPQSRTCHRERHISHDDIIRDVIIGFSDGLTVPFALTAGLSSLGNAHLVVMGGLAELFAGSISMGLGAYLAAVTESEHYKSEMKREYAEVEESPNEECEEIYEIMAKYNISRSAVQPMVTELCQDKDQWVRFMMDFELQLAQPSGSRAWISAGVMGLSYFVGGLVPMIPYFAMHNALHALFISIGITAMILLAFGYVKNWVTIRTKRASCWGAMQTLVIGAIAAGTSYGIVRGLNSNDDTSLS